MAVESRIAIRSRDELNPTLTVIDVAAFTSLWIRVDAVTEMLMVESRRAIR